MGTEFEKIVFCDFDGTITAVETFATMLGNFAPELSSQILPQIYNRTLTLRVGVRKMLESIPSKHYLDIIAYAQAQPIRPGLPEFISFLRSQNIPFVVVSGGLRGMVETVLKREGLFSQVEAIYAPDVETDQLFLKVDSPLEGGTELLSKVRVMNLYPARQTLAIGDSITDLNMCLNADLVFARDRLREYLEAENKAYIPWQDFFEIQAHLEKL